MSDNQIFDICDLFDDIECIKNVPPKLTNIDESVPEHIRKENAYLQNDLCYANDPIVIDWFLENGYDIDKWGISGHTPLHYQILRNDLSAVKHLIKRGANISKPNIYGDIPMNQALDFAGIEMFNLLNSQLNRTWEQTTC